MKFKDFLISKNVTEESFKAMGADQQGALHGEYLNVLSDTVAGAATKSDVDAVKASIEALKGSLNTEQVTKLEDTINELKTTVEEQGKRIIEQSKHSEPGKMKTFADAFKEAYDEVVEKSGTEGNFDFKVPANKEIVIDTTKAIVSSDVMSVNDVDSADFPTAGTTGVVNSTVRTLYSKLIGFFAPRIPSSRIMEFVDVQPLTEANLIAINESWIDTVEVTPECELKPIVRMDFDTQEASAEAVPAMWFTTTKLRRFYAALVNRMEQKFAELVNKKIPTVVLDAIRANATAFTPNAAFNINSIPNNYDALGAVIASLENLGYVPTTILMNPIAWRNMKQEKNAEGIYTLSNGQSIQLVASGLDWGGNVIPYVKDPELGVDEFIVGDLMESVKVGVDGQLMYMETDGRVDAQATTATTGLARNIRTHVIEKFVAVIVPDGSKTGLIRDTFSNVKTLIAAEPTT